MSVPLGDLKLAVNSFPRTMISNRRQYHLLFIKDAYFFTIFVKDRMWTLMRQK